MSNFVQGNFIGTDAAGVAPVPNVNHGVTVQDATYNWVGGAPPGSGNLISGNGLTGVTINSGGAAYNVVQGNLIGTDVSGLVAVPNGTRSNHPAIQILSAFNNLIGGSSAAERNVISGNREHGIAIQQPGATNNRVTGNFIGTDASGLRPLGNGLSGVLAQDAPGNVIGGVLPGEGNVIAGNGTGIQIVGPNATGNAIEGNLIGVDAAGLNAVPNQEGVNVVGSSANRIGGTSSTARNVISGNTAYGVLLNGGATGNEIFGNYIGTRADGLVAVGNGLAGVAMDAAPGNFIGGGNAGQGNLISGNGIGANAIGGVYLFQPASQNNVIAGNRIGTDPSGTIPVPNHVGIFFNGAANNRIGGTTASEGNIIAFSTWHGVVVYGPAATGNVILQNSIFGNSAMGIDLGPDGPTPNDPGDVDTGPNQLQNFPVITAAWTVGSTVIQGTMNAAPAKSFRLEFFANVSGDTSGHGEGQTFLGSMSSTTDENGKAVFTYTTVESVPAGHFVTATATDSDGNTSEFSPALEVGSSPRRPLNDQFVSASLLFGPEGTATGHNMGASGEPGEPSSEGHTVWWRWVAPATAVYYFNTFGSSFPTALAIYEGASVAELTLVSRGEPFVASSGAGYIIRVDGEAGAQGQIMMRWSTRAVSITDPRPPQPVADALVVLSGDASSFFQAGTYAPIDDVLLSTIDRSTKLGWSAAMYHRLIEEKYARAGGASGPLGAALGPPEECLHGNGYCQRFVNGEIVFYIPTWTGPYCVVGEIYRKWKALGGDTGFLRYPAQEAQYNNNRSYQVFRGGNIFYTPETQAHLVINAILNKYRVYTS